LRSKESIWKQSSVIVVTPSRWLLDRARRSVLAHAAAWSVAIPNGVDLSVFAPGDRLLARRALGIPDDAYVLLFVAHGGAANPYKDGATMEDAVRRIAARQPTGRRLLLLAVGGDPTRPVADLEHVTYVPYQSDQRALARYYRSADVYLHAAHADTFPTSVLEALACGTPVVATAVGGIPEQVRDGETGLLTPRGSPDAMASAAARLLQDADLRHAMSCAAVADARARFGLRRMLGDYLSLYERAIEEFRSRATAVPQYAFAARERSACGAKE
jgi:glycosyltransferase involved in cell wall biosynthesis